MHYDCCLSKQALAAVWATWTAPWTERGLRVPNRRQVRKVNSEARSVVKPNSGFEKEARTVLKRNIGFEK